MTYLIANPSDLPRIAQEITDSAVISLDLETTHLDPRLGHIRLLSINTGSSVAVIDCFQTVDPYPVIAALRTHRGVQIGHGLKFDQKWLLHHWSLELPNPFDTHRASQLIYNGLLRGHDLWALFDRELSLKPSTEDLGGSDWSGPLTPEQIRYAAEDVEHLPKLRIILREKLVKLGLVTAAKIEFGALLPEASMELNGFAFDKQAWLELARTNGIRERMLRGELLTELPDPTGQINLFDQGTWNLGSPAQLLKALWRAGVRVGDTAEATLAMAQDDFPVCKKIIDWRGFAQAVKSFGAEYTDNIHPLTGRIHTSFWPFTGAGRYASSKPNLQQIPRSKEFRQCFRPPPGRKLVVRDYSQIELRIAAELAQDETLMGVYIRGEDAHAQTASLIAGVSLAEVTKQQRQMAKPVNFGFIYGMQAPKFVTYAKSNYGVSITLPEAEQFRGRYFAGYPGIREWHREIFSDEHRAKKRSRTRSGRIRYLPEDAFNEHANTPVQGTGADGLKSALRCVYERLRPFEGKARMVHMVHDEIVLETDNDPELLTAVDAELEKGMVEGMQPFLKKVPVVVEGGVADSWADK